MRLFHDLQTNLAFSNEFGSNSLKISMAMIDKPGLENMVSIFKF